MSWQADSIMYRRGVARGHVTATHELTEVKQGTYHYTIGPYSAPVLHVAPGDRIIVETRDAFAGKIQTTRDLPTQVLRMPFVNPQNGPIMIAGAEPVAEFAEEVTPLARHATGQHEGEHADDRQTREDSLLVFAKTMKGIESHYGSSTYADEPPPRKKPRT